LSQPSPPSPPLQQQPKQQKKKNPITTATKFDLWIWFVCCFFVVFFFVLFLFCFSLCHGDRESTGRQGVKMMMTKKKKR
jgi:beta-lactamase regulating signal transducer with metallopeptidase domain